MNIALAYPSVPSFPQSSILLKRGEGRDSTPTETALGAFQIAAAQPQKEPGAYLYRSKSSLGRKRGDGTSSFSCSFGRFVEIV